MTMWKRKWFIPVVTVAVLLIGGIVGGVVIAGSDNSSNTEDQSQPTNRYQALLDRACAIYEENMGVVIDSEQLKDALDQARNEIQNEALESRLQDLVDEGKMTQEEADQYLEWWQSRPDVELPLLGLGGYGHGGGVIGGRGLQARGGPWFAPDTSDEAGD
jgi:hypothetical protein